MRKFRAERAIVLASLLALFFAGGYCLGRRTAMVVPASPGNVPVAVTTQRPVSGAEDAEDARLDLNSATAAQLTELPGIGEALAERIVAYRDENGPFSSVDELTNVSGIGEKKLDAVRALIKAEE